MKSAIAAAARSGSRPVSGPAAACDRFGAPARRFGRRRAGTRMRSSSAAAWIAASVTSMRPRRAGPKARARSRGRRRQRGNGRTRDRDPASAPARRDQDRLRTASCMRQRDGLGKHRQGQSFAQRVGEEAAACACFRPDPRKDQIEALASQEFGDRRRRVGARGSAQDRQPLNGHSEIVPERRRVRVAGVNNLHTLPPGELQRHLHGASVVVRASWAAGDGAAAHRDKYRHSQALLSARSNSVKAGMTAWASAMIARSERRTISACRSVLTATTARQSATPWRCWTEPEMPTAT